MTQHLRVLTVKGTQAAFPPGPFGYKNMNALKACQMARKWESFPDESFKYKLSRQYSTKHMHRIFMYLCPLVSTPLLL
jgi:hypothetical protein